MWSAGVANITQDWRARGVWLGQPAFGLAAVLVLTGSRLALQSRLLRERFSLAGAWHLTFMMLSDVRILTASKHSHGEICKAGGGSLHAPCDSVRISTCAQECKIEVCHCSAAFIANCCVQQGCHVMECIVAQAPPLLLSKYMDGTCNGLGQI